MKTRPSIFHRLLLRLSPNRAPAGSECSGRRVLSDLAPGERASIVGYRLPEEKFIRLLEMGLTSGTSLEVIRYAPLGDPIQIKARGYHLSLRKEEAAGIQVMGSEATC